MKLHAKNSESWANKWLPVCVHTQVTKLGCLFAAPWALNHQVPWSMGFFWQDYWTGLPFPPPEGLPNSGTKPISPVSPAWAGAFFTTEPPRKTQMNEEELLKQIHHLQGLNELKMGALCSNITKNYKTSTEEQEAKHMTLTVRPGEDQPFKEVWTYTHKWNRPVPTSA